MTKRLSKLKRERVPWLCVCVSAWPGRYNQQRAPTRPADHSRAGTRPAASPARAGTRPPFPQPRAGTNSPPGAPRAGSIRRTAREVPARRYQLDGSGPGRLCIIDPRPHYRSITGWPAFLLTHIHTLVLCEGGVVEKLLIQRLDKKEKKRCDMYVKKTILQKVLNLIYSIFLQPPCMSGLLNSIGNAYNYI